MTVSAKNTKAEILQAYHKLRQEKKALEEKLKQIHNKQSSPSARDRETTSSGEDFISLIRSILEKGGGEETMKTACCELENIISILEEIKLFFSAAVSKLSEELIAEVSRLQQQTEIDTQKQKLKELHNLETVEDSTLAQLIQEYQHSKEAFEKEY